MTSNRWLLPEGVQEVLPSEARSIESLRRRVLDLFHSRGYELVMPPLVEYTDSLLIGLGQDMDLHSFKMADQLSGKMLAVRPDITPQVARIDAHSLAREGVTRYCYAGSVLHTRPLAGANSRSPLQVGAELYGEASVEADIEIIALMIETVRTVSAETVCLDLGHVGIYRALMGAADISQADEAAIFEALQRKSESDLMAALQVADVAEQWQQALLDLLNITGDEDALNALADAFAELPVSVEPIIKQCRQVATAVRQRFENVDIFVDFTELRGYHYHTGLVFAAYIDGYGHAIANGGRYDDIGEVFGRPRPATGFSSSIDRLSRKLSAGQEQCVYVAKADAEAASEKVCELRQQGLPVIIGFSEGSAPENCTHVLAQENNTWVLNSL